VAAHPSPLAAASRAVVRLSAWDVPRRGMPLCRSRPRPTSSVARLKFTRQ